MFKRFLLVNSIILVLFFCLTSNATIVLKIPLKQLFEKSESIIHGKVIGMSPYINSKNNRVYSKIKVTVFSWLKGDGSNSITITKFGGELNNIKSTLPGDAQFEEGEEVVLAIRNVNSNFYLTALSQSKFTISTDINTNIKTATRNINGSTVVHKDNNGNVISINKNPVNESVLFNHLVQMINDNN